MTKTTTNREAYGSYPLDINVRSITSTGDITLRPAGNIVVEKDIIPSLDNQISIGSQLKNFTRSWSKDIQSSDTIRLIPLDGEIRITGDLIPSLNTIFKLGLTSNQWIQCYSSSLESANGINIKSGTGNIQVFNSIIPDTDLTKNFGSSDKRFQLNYSRNLISPDGVTLDAGTGDIVVKNDILPDTTFAHNIGSSIKSFSNLYCPTLVGQSDLELRAGLGDIVVFNSIRPFSPGAHNIGTNSNYFNRSFINDNFQEVDFADFARRLVLSTATTTYQRVTSLERSTLSKYYANNDNFRIPNAGEFLFVCMVKMSISGTDNELQVRLRNLTSTGFSNVSSARSNTTVKKDFEIVCLYWRCEINNGEEITMEWRALNTSITNVAIENGRIYCLRNFVW